MAECNGIIVFFSWLNGLKSMYGNPLIYLSHDTAWRRYFVVNTDEGCCWGKGAEGIVVTR